MELLAKMSEAYMKEKAEKTEVAARVATLEAENKTLKNQLAEARRREQEERERSQEVGSVNMNIHINVFKVIKDIKIKSSHT